MKRLLALLLALALLTLCACTVEKAKPDDRESEPNGTTAPTETETKPAETEPPVSYEGLVFTGLTEEITDVDGNVMYYNVPQIALDGDEIDALNVQIMEEFSAKVYSSDGTYPEFGSIDYTWNYAGDLLSVVIHTEYYHYAWPEFYVYNVSISECRPLDDETVLAAYGLTMEDYCLEVQKSLAAEWLRRAEQAADVTMLDPRTDYYAGRQYQKSLLTENVLDSTPYVGADGELFTVVQNGSVAGADYYWGTYPVGTDYELPGDWTVLGMWAIDNDWS